MALPACLEAAAAAAAEAAAEARTVTPGAALVEAEALAAVEETVVLAARQEVPAWH